MAIEKKIVKSKVYKVVKAVEASDKCPPQARLIVDTITAAGGSLGRDELMTLLKRAPEQGGLKTNQTAERILAFYRPKLVAMGVLKEDVVETTIEVEVPDKPAPAPAAAAAEAGAAAGAPASDAKGVKGAKGTRKEVAA